MQASLVGNS
jgi:hypothetical protein